MILIFLIVIIIILILVYFLLKNKYTSNFKNYIKGNELNDTIKYDNTGIYLGKNIQTDYITFDTQFYLKVNVPKFSNDNDNLGTYDRDTCPSNPNWKLPNGKCCDTKFTDSKTWFCSNIFGWCIFFPWINAWTCGCNTAFDWENRTNLHDWSHCNHWINCGKFSHFSISTSFIY